MISNFLKNVYLKQRISLNQAKSLLPDFSVDTNVITKSFKFDSFEDATVFMGRVNDYCFNKNIKVEISNVYDKVNVVIREDFANELTKREITAAFVINSIFDNSIDKIVKNDYYGGDFSVAPELSLDINNQEIETSNHIK